MNMQQSRAVSPVIGVILMVAISVILAAVVGAFVLEIADGQSTAPDTGFTTTEDTRLYKGIETDPNCYQRCNTNLTTVRIQHTGGDTIAIDRLNAVVNGNDSAYGSPTTVDRYTDPCGGSCSDAADPGIVPQPNIMASWGRQTAAPLTAGDDLDILAYGGLRPETIVPERRRPTTDTLQWAIRDDNDFYCTDTDAGLYDTGSEIQRPTTAPYNPTPNIYFNRIGGDGACTKDLDAGDNVALTWRAASGGRSQILREHTVRTSNTNQ